MDEPGTHVRQHHITLNTDGPGRKRHVHRHRTGPEPSAVEGRIGNGPWVEVATLNDDDFTLQDWSWTWDSTAVEDGDHYVAVRFVNQSGAVSGLSVAPTKWTTFPQPQNSP